MNKLKKITAVISILLVIIICTSCVEAAEVRTIDVPQGYGYGTLHTYTVWDRINWGGDCRKLLNFARSNDAVSDTYGVVTYGSYFCGALTSTYGKVGDMMLIIEEDNIVYPVIMADTKNQNDRGCNMYGHQYGKCVVEFEILSSCRKSLYGTSGGYVSDILAKPIVKVINLGSVFDDASYFYNPKQACLDNGLEGYTLLSNPYGGDIILEEVPQQVSVIQNYAINPNVMPFLISWFDKFKA